jgi:hypothetical protein
MRESSPYSLYISSRQETVFDVAMRTPISIFLLSALLVGILSPTGMCALMCEHRLGTESQIHCGEQHHQACLQ